MSILTLRRPENPPAAEYRYNLHMGVVGGPLRPLEVATLRDDLASRFHAPIRITGDADNFHEWCEPFDAQAFFRHGTVASASGHLVIDVPFGIYPLDIYQAVVRYLPHRKFLTREEIAETGHCDLARKPFGPYVVTSAVDWETDLEDAAATPLDKATADQHGWWVLIEHNDDLADHAIGPWPSEAAAKWAVEESPSIEGYCCDTKRPRFVDEVAVLDEPMTIGDAMGYYLVLCPTDEDLTAWKQTAQ